MADRSNAVLIGHGRDEFGFKVEILENPVTGARMLAYTPEDWWERGRYLTHLDAHGRRKEAEYATTTVSLVE